MNPRRLALIFAAAAAVLAPLAAHAQADKATIDAIEGYFDFVDANAGTILPEQIPAEDYSKFHVLDVRDAGQFAKEHIPGAVNIEWRQVFAQRAKLPRDKTILVYCNTSSFAAQVAMALAWTGSRTCGCCTAASARGRRAAGSRRTRGPAASADRTAGVPGSRGASAAGGPCAHGRRARVRLCAARWAVAQCDQAAAAASGRAGGRLAADHNAAGGAANAGDPA